MTVEDNILTGVPQFGVNRVIDIQLPGIDDRHVHARWNGVIQKDAVHRPAHRLIATKAEGQVGKTTRNMHMRAARLDLSGRFDEIDAVIVMLLNTRGDREHIGIKDDIFRRKANACQQLIGARANFDLALFGVRLPFFVKGHHNHSRTIGHAFAGVIEKRLFAFLHADRIDDGLARNAFQASLYDVPF